MLSILKNQAIKGLEGVLKGTYTLHNWVGGVGLSPPPMDGISEIIVFSGVSGPKLDAEPSYTEKKLCPPLENFCLRPLLPSLALDVQGCRVSSGTFMDRGMVSQNCPGEDIASPSRPLQSMALVAYVSYIQWIWTVRTVNTSFVLICKYEVKIYIHSFFFSINSALINFNLFLLLWRFLSSKEKRWKSWKQPSPSHPILPNFFLLIFFNSDK